MTNAPEDKIQYPENSVLGVFDSTERVTSAVSALTAGGFLESEIEVICGLEGGEKLRATTGRSGLMNVAMRVVSKLGMPDQETEIKDRYADALTSGRFVLAVRIASDDRKGSATQILKANGARFVHFLGKFVIESMTPRQGEISAEGR
jgi:hypothetical protein